MEREHEMAIKEKFMLVHETMTEREYELISKATKVLCHYYEKENPKTFPIFHGTCDA